MSTKGFDELSQLEERMVNAMLEHKTPYDVSVEYGCSIDYVKALFPFGNYDSVAEACRRMFLRGLSAIEIGSLLHMEPILVRKIIGVTLYAERTLVALLRMSDNGFTVSKMADTFNCNNLEIIDMLEKFGRIGTTKGLSREFYEDVKKLDPKNWYNNLRNDIVLEVESDLRAQTEKRLNELVDNRVEEIALDKSGLAIDAGKADPNYEKRVIAFSRNSLGITEKDLMSYLIRKFGKSLGVVSGGKLKEAPWRQDAIARYKMNRLGDQDIAPPQTEAVVKAGNTTILPEHLRGLA